MIQKVSKRLKTTYPWIRIRDYKKRSERVFRIRDYKFLKAEILKIIRTQKNKR
ncbi:hypothetical protein SAMN04489724_2313 [Algoriphagus locisalis]|uniref:Uncharacterized protein n=1 Tax=Algoriphagus locisalis TaxID=305507 RepID=A0A1I7BDE1_9BACT|nr:hypothetical protein SAMN04489724_2313 [Algoriphagus locisalis]